MEKEMKNELLENIQLHNEFGEEEGLINISEKHYDAFMELFNTFEWLYLDDLIEEFNEQHDADVERVYIEE